MAYTPFFAGTDPDIAYENLPANNRGQDIRTVQRRRLIQVADRVLDDVTVPVVELISSGTTVITPEVRRTRRGFTDFKKIWYLAQAWAYNGQQVYFDKANEFLTAWAAVNEPEGNPINQTHFRAIHVAFNAMRGDMTGGDETLVEDWIDAMARASEAFDVGGNVGTIGLYGNHYTHHYMQLLSAYDVLGETTNYNNLLTTIDAHAAVNFPNGNGAIDIPASTSILASNVPGAWFEIAGDRTSTFPVDEWCYVWGTPNSDHAYKVVSSTYIGGSNRTRIVVRNFEGNQDIGGGDITGGVIYDPYDPDVDHSPRQPEHDGESIDYIRRDAMHYQTYDMEPWSEIAIITGTRYATLMADAWAFFLARMLSPTRKHYEFANTIDDFDAARWAGSNSEYLQPRSMYIPDKACRYVLAHHTWARDNDASWTDDGRWLAQVFQSSVLTSHWPHFFRWVIPQIGF